ncbi:MAG: hypothetical protein ACLR8Y_18320 [Alistipes indistinctus]
MKIAWGQGRKARIGQAAPADSIWRARFFEGNIFVSLHVSPQKLTVDEISGIALRAGVFR